MQNPDATRRLVLLGLLTASTALPAQAHDFRAGAVHIDHPYATPTPAGATNGAVYFRSLRNRAATDDRLVGASTPIAERVELHTISLDGGVMRMRALEAIELPAGKALRLRHGQTPGQHLMLVHLKKPLLVGDRFDLTLKFAQGGEVLVKVWVQQPRDSANGQHRH